MVEIIQEWSFRHRRLLLTLLVAIGLMLRLSGLASISLAEDEVNKINAVHSYLQGDFSANSEHPMLMKGLIFILWKKCFGTPISTDRWASQAERFRARLFWYNVQGENRVYSFFPTEIDQD